MEINLQKSSQWSVLMYTQNIDRSKNSSVRSGPVRASKENSMTVQSGP